VEVSTGMVVPNGFKTGTYKAKDYIGDSITEDKLLDIVLEINVSSTPL
jgi:hypothetical protein